MEEKIEYETTVRSSSVETSTTTTINSTRSNIENSVKPKTNNISNGNNNNNNNNNNNVSGNKNLHISEQPYTISNWYKHLNWLNMTLVVFIPMIGYIMAPFTPLKLKTLIWACFYYLLTGISITSGYHRLWAHRAYNAKSPVRLIYALIGGGAVEGSARWWSAGHRVHHRWTDTDRDPYSIRKGIVYAHLGWMLLISNPKNKGRTDISDLDSDPIVRWQHKHYLFVMITMAVIFPTIVAGLGWGDWWGGFVYAGIIRFSCVQHATFCVNSLAHWLGEQPFDDRRSPRDHVITALVTFGEGYHNFHHEFPSDYRNAIKWYQWDPTKWLIWTLHKLGLASDLKTFSQNAIEQGLVQQKQKKLDQWRRRLNWGVPLDQLPVIEYDTFVAESKKRSLVVISGVVHDISSFIDNHPGGRALIVSAIGKDATANFNGGVYDHSNAAHNLLATMRVGVIRGGCEVEVWKQAQKENKEVTIPTDTYNEQIVRAGFQVTRVSRPIPTAGAA